MTTTPSEQLALLARNLKAIMGWLGINQPEMRRRTGVSQKTISNILNQVGNPQLDKLTQIANGLGIPVWVLLMPNLDERTWTDSRIQDVVQSFMRADEQGRTHLHRAARLEADASED